MKLIKKNMIEALAIFGKFMAVCFGFFVLIVLFLAMFLFVVSTIRYNRKKRKNISYPEIHNWKIHKN